MAASCYNTYTWYRQVRDKSIVEVIAFFDSIEVNDLWSRVQPACAACPSSVHDKSRQEGFSYSFYRPSHKTASKRGNERLQRRPLLVRHIHRHNLPMGAACRYLI